MTADEVLEAMARGIAKACGHEWELLSNLGRAGYSDLARAAVRAAQEVGAILVAEMPGDTKVGYRDWVRGYNQALAAVRAKAVTP